MAHNLFRRTWNIYVKKQELTYYVGSFYIKKRGLTNDRSNKFIEKPTKQDGKRW